MKILKEEERKKKGFRNRLRKDEADLKMAWLHLEVFQTFCKYCIKNTNNSLMNLSYVDHVLDFGIVVVVI